MAAALENQSLATLCSGPTTLAKAKSILILAKAKTGPGTGYLVAHPNALPGICAYLASEELNNNEVSQKAAVASACISQRDFSRSLDVVRQALGPSKSQHQTRGLNYRSLIGTWRVAPANEALEWMREAESSVPKIDLLRTRHRASTVTCAIFYWICQIMEIQGVHEKPLCQAHSVPVTAFKSVMKALDKDWDSDALVDRVKSHLQAIASSGPSSNPRTRTRPSASPQKSPSKSAMKAKALPQDITPSKPLALKRAVAFSHSTIDDSLLPETPTKRRRVESPSKSGARPKRITTPQETGSTTAFELAMRGDSSSTPRREHPKSAFGISITGSGGSHSTLPFAGPSTPRRTRPHTSTSRLGGEPTSMPTPTAVSMEVDEQQAEIEIEKETEPAQPPVRNRFRPVFLDQQQWCSRDPRLAKIWDAAVEHRVQMMGLYVHPFERWR
ncbi:hypothetical protein DEU56DRAFT_911077 [Suillus clintonianus]|uniref:uncharacterized protein n=1 Tax=Suillus clintonianus TaxID=1904413 RepID=UPI001B87ACA4|nr:uncharacterized protein DEU56DRAFT_911077 [Suillus clintonianus]KAG2142374.1 hypothetical protein DEU56DRAFT_911077 [Suillus clintonianus]